jgi:type IV pilus assembly protein PilV
MVVLMMPFIQSNQPNQRGSMMLEVLVTIVILSIGLLGLAGLQAKLQSAEMESYQRAQALLLLSDMANRLATNRNAAADYVTDSPLGVGADCPAADSTQVTRDVAEWCQALQGVSEVSGDNNVGAMIGGRGCIENTVGNSFMISVAWQGLTPISAPPQSVSCGSGSYDDANLCQDDRCRRFVTTIVNIADL